MEPQYEGGDPQVESHDDSLHAPRVQHAGGQLSFSSLQVFTKDGAFLREWGDAQFEHLHVVGINHAICDLYVGDYELATIRRYELPIKIVLIDNACLGMVRQWQQLFHAERLSEVELSDNPDFVQVAEAFGVPAFRVDERGQVDAAIERLLTAPGPMLAHVPIDPAANVWPLVPPGCSNSKMLEEAS